jgi:A/G-specific adenine glycosylase
MGLCKNIHLIAPEIINWWRKNGDIFLWRSSKNSFHILIAEILLQRTSAQKVVPIYEVFISKFHSPELLSQVETCELEKILAPLGLFRRKAMALKEISKIIKRKHNGEVPNRKKDLLDFPMVGEYTADAILCFAFNEKKMIIDVNVSRILIRVYPKFCERASVKRILEEISRKVKVNEAKEFNWGLIDLGRLICKSRTPKCNFCPILDYCSYPSETKIRISS